MKIVKLGRGKCKSTAAIMESSKTCIPILVYNRNQIKMLEERAKSLGLDIPEPVTLIDHLAKNGNKKPFRVIVDETEQILKALLDTELHMITLTEDKNMPNTPPIPPAKITKDTITVNLKIGSTIIFANADDYTIDNENGWLTIFRNGKKRATLKLSHVDSVFVE